MPRNNPEYVIYDRVADEFVSPICNSVEDLKESLHLLDQDADEDDYQIMTVTKTVEHRLLKSGWSIDRV
jgi:hypothetical protein